jgi:hypothetical protein
MLKRKIKLKKNAKSASPKTKISRPQTKNLKMAKLGEFAIHKGAREAQKPTGQ